MYSILAIDNFADQSQGSLDQKMRDLITKIQSQMVRSFKFQHVLRDSLAIKHM